MADPKATDEKKKQEGRTSAQKRNLQSEKTRLARRSDKATILTAVRSLEASIAQKEAPEAIKEKLNKIYSLMDKGVKKGLYKTNKAARTKSRLAARCS